MVSRLSIGGCCCGDCRYFGFAVFPTWVLKMAADLAAIEGNPHPQGYYAAHVIGPQLEAWMRPFAHHSVTYYLFDVEDLPTRSFRTIRYNNSPSPTVWADGKHLSAVFVGGLGIHEYMAANQFPSNFGQFEFGDQIVDWWFREGFYLPTAGSSDFDLLRSYLSTGGTVYLRLPFLNVEHRTPEQIATMIGRINQFFVDIGSGCRVEHPIDSELFGHRVAWPTLADATKTAFPFMASPTYGHPVNDVMDYSVAEQYGSVSTPPGEAYLDFGSGPRRISNDGFIWWKTGNARPLPLALHAPDSAVESYAYLVRQLLPPDDTSNAPIFFGRKFLSDGAGPYEVTSETGPPVKTPTGVHERLPGGGHLLLVNPIGSTLTQRGPIPSRFNNVPLNWSLSKMSQECRVLKSGWYRRPTALGGYYTANEADGLPRRTIPHNGRKANGQIPSAADDKWNGQFGAAGMVEPCLVEYDGTFPVYTISATPVTAGSWQNAAGLYRIEFTTPEQPVDGPDNHEGLRVTLGRGSIADPIWWGSFPTVRYVKQLGDGGYLNSTGGRASGVPLYAAEPGIETDDRAFWVSWYLDRVADFVPLGIFNTSDVAAIDAWLSDPEAPPVTSRVRDLLLKRGFVNIDQVGRPVTESPSAFDLEWYMIDSQPRLNWHNGTTWTWRALDVQPVVYQSGRFFFDSNPRRVSNNFSARSGEHPDVEFAQVRRACLSRLSNLRSADGRSLDYSIAGGTPFLPLVQFETGPLQWNTFYRLDATSIEFDLLRRTPPSRFAELYGALPTL